MAGSVSKPENQRKLSVLQWVAVLITFAGLFVLFATENQKEWTILIFLAAIVNLADNFVRKAASPQPIISLLHPDEDAAAKIKIGLLFLVGLVITLTAFIFIGHLRIFALLMMVGLFTLFLDRYISASARVG